MVGAAVAGSAVAGLAGSAISGSAAESAAGKAASAQQAAAQLQMQIYQQNAANLAPYNKAGTAILPQLQSQTTTGYNAVQNAYNNAQSQLPSQMTQAQLVQTPGYQFNLSQGLKATQNSAASQGLGVSGTALKAAGGFATGLANSTYAQQLANQATIYNAYNQQFSNQYNAQGQQNSLLQGIAGLGENAAATTGYQGNQAAAAAGSNIAGAGASEAAGITTAANAYSSGLSNAGNAGIQYLGINNLLNSGNLNSNAGSGSGSNPGPWGGYNATGLSG